MSMKLLPAASKLSSAANGFPTGPAILRRRRVVVPALYERSERSDLSVCFALLLDSSQPVQNKKIAETNLPGGGIG